MLPVNGHLLVSIKVILDFLLATGFFFGLFANQIFLINSAPKIYTVLNLTIIC